MRVTNAIMVNTSLTNLQKSLNALQKYQTQVQTGKKISTASEDPVVASKSMRYKTRLYERINARGDFFAATSNKENPTWISKAKKAQLQIEEDDTHLSAVV